MATAPKPQHLPVFYKDLRPLSSNEHGSWRARRYDTAPFLVGQHAIPLTIDEFVVAQRHYPIIFSVGPNPVPLALMGMNEGVNTFLDEEGKLREDTYIPAYVRRYPFLLAKLRPDRDELSLCFDPTSDAIGAFDDGEPLFTDGQPSEATKAVLAFCEQFEQAGQRTAAFMQELVEAKVLIDGEVSIQQNDNPQPFVYRGFQMVSEDAMKELRGDTLRKMAKNGMLPLIYAHLFSLGIMREIFGRQVAQGKVPQQQMAPVPAM